MVERAPGDEAGREGPPHDDGVTPPRSAPGSSAHVADTEPADHAAAPGRSQGRTPGVELDLERAQARARLRANLFQIESAPLRIGRFTILSHLGQGGMGAVYAAYDEDLDRKVAVKVMLPQSGSPTARARMRREAQAMARLSHPNIVTVHEVGELGEQVYIAMEFVRGRSLEQWLREQDRPWPEVLGVFRRAGQGLHAAHAAGLVHRDFKPQNVMVGDDGSVKVLDFGLARDQRSFEAAASPDDAATDTKLLDRALTHAGALVGTPAYMAPEQHEGAAITARSDQFSFCVALHLGLWGEHPFEGDTLPALVASVCEGTLRTPPHEGRVPAWVRAVVRRGLATDPRARYPSMAALLDALAHDPRARRRRTTALGAAVLAVFAGGVIAARVGRSPEPSCPDPREALHGVWDDDQQQQVAASLAASDSPRAAPTWVRIEPALDRYADAWSDARGTACAQWHDGISSDLLYERRMACLDRGRAALQALVEVLAQADPDVIDKAAVAVASLPAVDRCEDAARLLAELDPPPAAIAHEVAALRQDLSRSESLEHLGRLPDALRTATAVQERAEALGYPPLHAEALLRRGSIHLTAREGEAAEQSLGQALWAAVELGHDAVAAEAAARRLFVRAELLGQPDQALVELPWARALVARADDPVLEGLYLNNAATVYIHQQLATAEALLARALQSKRRSSGPDHPEYGFTLHNLGYVQRDRGALTAAAQSLQEASAVFEASLGPSHPYRAMAARNLASVLIARGRFAEAEAEVRRVEQIHRDNREVDARLGLEILALRGRLALEQRRWADAEQIFARALARSQAELGPEHLVTENLQLGLAEALAGAGRRTEAEARVRRYIEALPDAPQSRGMIVGAWFRLGRLLLGVGAAEDARHALEQAHTLGQQLEGEAPEGDARRESWLGRARLAAGDVAGAEPLVRASARALQQLEPIESPWVLAALEGLAALEQAQGHAAAAVEALTTVEAQVGEHRAPDDPALAWVRARLAHARLDAEPSDRAATIHALQQAHAVLAAHPGWSDEAARARAWLQSPTP